jgi:4'-phosphopantetheinyl transferase
VQVADDPEGLGDGPAADSATLAALVIRNAADGAPEVIVDGRLAPVHISMTDRADWAVCVALSADRSGGAVGCDLEVVEPRSDRFVADWFTASERELVGADPDERDVLANLIWSAKESALKVLRTGLRRDTRSVEVSFPDLAAEGWRALRVDTEEGLSFPGWWRRFGDFVLSFASVAETPPPAPLTDPSPLLAARPTHRWMDRPRRARP